MLWVGAGAGGGRGGAPGVCPAPAVGRHVARIRSVQRQSADHRQHQPPAAGLRRHPDRRVVRAAGRRQHAAQDAARAASGADRLRHAPRARGERACDVVRTDARLRSSASTRKPSGASPELPGVDRVAVGSAVPWRDAGSFGSGIRILGRRPRPRAGRRRSARAVPHGLARIFRGARRADSRRTRFQRSRPPRQRAGRHREPEPGAADVPQSGCGQPPHDVDRSGDEIHRRQHRPPAHRRRRGRCRR